MSNSIFTKLASIVTIIFFLGNDLLASVGAFHRLEMMEIAKYTSSTNYSDAMAQPETTSYPRSQPKTQASGSVDPIVLPDLFSNRAEDKTAFIGAHDKDPLGSPNDDVFSIDLQDQIKNYQFAYLQYEVKGIANAEELPKAINGGEVYVGGELKASDTWQRVMVMVDYEDLINGNNQVRFALSKSSELAAEVKNVQIHLTAKPKAVNKGLKMKRQMADVKDFKLLVSSENALTFKNKDLEMASIPKSIRNLTRNAWGYGLRNNDNEVVKVAIGVNASKLNTPNDLKEANVFYYNTEDNSWKKAHTEKVDMANLVLEASVPPNTDYFAGLIKSPDMPEASAFVPTGISGIEAANPAAGMNLMNPPQQSKTGEANLSYPLNIPAGRQGLTPSLALNYNSDAGTGWLGVGWNLSTPSVSIDTRWGVPAFPASIQEEVYTLNGQTLVQQNGGKGNRAKIIEGEITFTPRLSGNVRFFPRVMASYREIERVGNGPQEYFWVETDANQTKYYYGSLEGTRIHENSVLRDDDNNIVKWFLARIEDQWGNQIEYDYSHIVNSNSNNPMLSGGRAVVPKEIVYNGHNDNQGLYKVEFITSSNRMDANISMKYGFKLLDDQLLTKINIFYAGYNIRSYEFTFEQNNFFKTQLKGLEEYGEDGTNLFYEHQFEYYENDLTYSEPQELKFNHYDANIIDVKQTKLDGIHRVLQNIYNPSPINTSYSRGWSADGGVGLGVTPLGTSWFNGKKLTFSGNFGEARTFDKRRIGLRDMNGDGIPDLLYDKDGIGRGFIDINRSKDEVLIGNFIGIRNNERLYTSKTVTNSNGFDFTYSDNLFFFGMNWNRSKSTIDKYLTDYNADGFPDLVGSENNDQGEIQFGQLDNNGLFVFSNNSETTPNPVVKGIELSSEEENAGIKDIEMVKSWTAPFTGNIDISGNVELLGNLEGEVHAGIQKNNAFLSPGFTTVNITSALSTNYNNISVSKGDVLMFRLRSGLDGKNDLVTWDPKVTYNNQNLKDGNDIDYSNSSYEDGFLLSGGQFVNILGDQNLILELNREVGHSLADDLVTFIQIDELNDDHEVLSSRVYKNILVEGSTSFTNDIFNLVQGSGPTTINFDITSPQILPGAVSTNNYNLYFSLFSTSNVDWKAVKFRPIVKLTDAGTCDFGEELYPIPRLETYNRVGTMNPKFIPNSTQLGTINYRIWPEFSNSSTDVSDIFDDLAGTNNTAKVFMTVKNGSRLLSKMVLSFNQNNGLITYYTCDEIGANGTVINSNTPSSQYSLDNPDFTEGMYIEFFIEDFRVGTELKAFLDNFLSKTELQAYQTNWTDVESPTDNWNSFFKQNTFLGDKILQWGQFAWSYDKLTPENTPISTDELKPDFSNLAFDEENQFDSETLPDSDFFDANKEELNPINHHFFMLIPQRGEESFMLRSYELNSYSPLVLASKISPSVSNVVENLDRYSFMNQHLAIYASSGMSSPGKFGEEFQDDQVNSNSIPNTSPYKAFGASIYGSSKSVSTTVTGTWNQQNTAGLSYTHGDENTNFSSSSTSFSDYNGDGYPDKINEDNGSFSGILTSPLGGHKIGMPMIGSSDVLSKNLNWSVLASYSYNFGNNDRRFLAATAAASIGQNRILVQSIDLNGDGLPDHVFREEVGGDYPFSVGLGNGNGYENQQLPPVDDAEMPLNEVYSGSLGIAYSTLKLKGTKGKGVFGGSFRAGLNINAIFDRSERSFVDVNGDGLVDVVTMDFDKPEIYINSGAEWIKFNQSSPAINWEKGLNKTNGQGISLIAGGALSFTYGTAGIVEFKASLSAGGALNSAINGVNSALIDMNGDGVPDYVIEDGLGRLLIAYAELKENGLLKKVTNPLKGSFTIAYDRLGNKNGHYSTQIKTHLIENQKILWDMGYSKWVMSELSIDDGYNLELNGEDLDGIDQVSTFFTYDGGVHSRREREFLGFSMLEKKYLPFTNPEKSQSSATTFESSHYPKIYITEVQSFMAPIKNEFQYRKRSEYQNKILKESYNYYNIIKETEIQGGEDSYFEYTEEIYPMSAELYEYEFRNVCQESTSISFNQVYDEASNERLIDWDLVDETQTIFPALIGLQQVNYPDMIIESNRDKYISQKYLTEYDDLFNIKRYENEGKLTGRISGKRLVEAYQRWYYDYITEENRFLQPSEKSFDLSDANFDVYILACNSDNTYCNDTVYIPTSLDPCYNINSIYDENFTVISQHRKLLMEDIEIWEPYFEDTYVDKLIAVMEYYPSSSANGQTGLLKKHKTYVNDDKISANLRRRTEVGSLEVGNRAPNTIWNFLGTLKAVTDISYDFYGNTTSITGPENLNGPSERIQIDYTFDPVHHQHITQVNNVSFSETTCNVYNHKNGNLQKTIDVNGHAMRYIYDEFQRLIEIWAPRQLYRADEGSSATIQFEYYPFGINSGSSNANDKIPVAITKNNMETTKSDDVFVTPLNSCSVQFSDNYLLNKVNIPSPVLSSQFIDGSGRLLQIKKDAAKENGNGVNGIMRSVSGFTKLNRTGSPARISNSFLENLSQPLGRLSMVKTDSINTVDYDYMNRKTIAKVRVGLDPNSNHDWTQSTTIYRLGNIGGIPMARTKTESLIDGDLSISVNFYDSRSLKVLSRQTTIVSSGPVPIYETSFVYDELGQLRSTTDPRGFTTSYEYDNFGRTTEEDHPDRGISTFTYDLSGNLISKIVPKTNTTTHTINYDYLYNRIISKVMPESDDLYNVSYVYGGGNNNNGKGRITSVVQGNNFKTDVYKYDELGNLIYEEKSMTVPNYTFPVYTTEFDFDSWGRLLEMIYPDGEIVNYSYLPSGELERIHNGTTTNPQVWVPLEKLLYDGFGNVLTLEYGNGAKTNFTYDGITRQIEEVEQKTLNSSNSLVTAYQQNFTYNNGGVITGVSHSNTDPSVVGPIPHDYTFDYDAFDRLTSTTGSINNENYSLTMTYNDVGGILSKIQTLTGTVNAPLNHNLAYIYKSANNQINTLNGDSYRYNAAGSLEETGPVGNPTQTFVRNEEQLLVAVENSNGYHHYIYDHKGERIMKSTYSVTQTAVDGQGNTSLGVLDPYTVYINAYYVTTPYYTGDEISKHYYMGSQRIASEIKIADNKPSSGESSKGNSLGAPSNNFNRTQQLKDVEQNQLENPVLQNLSKIFSKLDLEEGIDYRINDLKKAHRIEEYYDIDVLDMWQLANSQQLVNNGDGLKLSSTESGGAVNFITLHYWYHPNYLGNMEMISDLNGEVHQYFVYSPFGENLYQWDANTLFNSPFRFNGKEEDPETGNQYFGARYYDPKLGLWLSVDPLADKFPHLSTYNFVLNNPVKLVDPDGKAPGEPPSSLVYSIKMTIGFNSDWQPNMMSSLMVGYTGKQDNWQAIIYASVDFTAGQQLGTSLEMPFNFNFQLGGYGEMGSGQAGGHSIYSTSYNTPLPIKNTFEKSVGLGSSLMFSTSISNKGGDRRAGYQFNMWNQVRFGSDFSLNSQNDIYLPGLVYGLTWLATLGKHPQKIKNIDAGISGGTSFHFGNNGQIIWGYQQFTGTYRENSGIDYPGNYEQTPYQKSFNRANTFFQVNGLRLDYSWKPWLQDIIHYFTENRSFDHYNDNFNKLILNYQIDYSNVKLN